MKNHFLSRFDSDNLRKAIIYFVIALTLIIISLALDINENGWATCMFLIGMAFFFMQRCGSGKMQNIMESCVSYS